nr:aldehyde dehydrogenase family protein [Actinomadura sp. J1-007]
MRERRADTFVAAECRNTGKPTAATRTEEVFAAADCLRFFAGTARLLPGLAAAEYASGHTSNVRREPVGVIGQVAPWNYSLLMAAWKLGPALAAGNTVVFKPGDTPVTAAMFGELAAECLPPGVLNIVCGDRDTGRAVVAHPAAAMVSITGSTRTGVEVARAAAERVARTHLELGVAILDGMTAAEQRTVLRNAAQLVQCEQHFRRKTPPGAGRCVRSAVNGASRGADKMPR